MDTDEVMARWRELVPRVEALAAKCMADPTQAPLDGVEPMNEYGDDKPLFGIMNGPRPFNAKAGWLRGAAKRLVPPEFKWEVKEMVGGNCALMLLGWEPLRSAEDLF